MYFPCFWLHCQCHGFTDISFLPFFFFFKLANTQESQKKNKKTFNSFPVLLSSEVNTQSTVKRTK